MKLSTGLGILGGVGGALLGGFIADRAAAKRKEDRYVEMELVSNDEASTDEETEE